MSILSAVSILTSDGESETQVLAVPLSELIIGIIAFFVVFGLLAKLALPGIRKALDERTAQIEGGITFAENQQAEAAALKAEYERHLAEAREEAAAIRAQAQADKTTILEEARREAAEAAAQIRSRAEASIAAERASAVSSLQREVGDLAVSLAGKVVGQRLDDDAAARATVDAFLADLEATAGTAATSEAR